jgi:integrase
MLFLNSLALDEVIASAKAIPRPIRGMHLICDRKGLAYKYGTFNTHWLKAVRKAGIQGLHFHDIRGKAATDAQEMGLDYQKLLGHSTKAMSDKYIKVRKIDRVTTLPGTVSSA